jgi:hypothetical protein
LILPEYRSEEVIYAIKKRSERGYW